MNDASQPEPYADALAAFFRAHPEALAGVKYVTLTPGGTPEMSMNSETIRLFVRWGEEAGWIKDREKIRRFLHFVTQIEHGEHGRGDDLIRR